MCCRQGIGIRWFVMPDGASMSREMHPIASSKTDFGWFTAFVSPRALSPRLVLLDTLNRRRAGARLTLV